MLTVDTPNTCNTASATASASLPVQLVKLEPKEKEAEGTPHTFKIDVGRSIQDDVFEFCI